MDSNDDTYKLYYFNANGREMIIRAILEYSKVKWEDIKVSNEEWDKMKNSSQCEYGQLPILEYNGKTYSQSHSIELFLGKKFNLYGTSIDDEYQINSLLDSFDDLFIVFHAYAAPTNDEDKKNKERIKQEFIMKLEFFANVYDKHYEKNGYKKYYIGDTFSIADIFVCCVLFYYSHVFICEDMYEKKIPKLYNLIKEIRDNELKDFFDKRFIKETDF